MPRPVGEINGIYPGRGYSGIIACGKIALADIRQRRTDLDSFSGTPGGGVLAFVVTDDTAGGLAVTCDIYKQVATHQAKILIERLPRNSSLNNRGRCWFLVMWRTHELMLLS